MDQNIKPKVTVLMPVHNAAPFLKEAVQSILDQTFEDFEFLIINDGSTDNSIQILESFNDNRIKITNNEKNIGIIKSRNKILHIAQGQYIAKMDADDISLPTRLQKQVDYLDQHPEVAVIAAKLILVDEEGKEKGYWTEDFNYKSIDKIKKNLPHANCVGQPTVMMRGEIAKLIGYNEKFLHNEDWGLWLELLSKGFVIAKLDEVLLKYRIHSNSTTVKSNVKGVEKKIVRFKFSYLIDKISKRELKGTDYEVLSSFFTDIIKFIMPQTYLFAKRIYKVRPIKLFKQFWLVRNQLLSIQYPVTNIFFFPSYCTGGADKVHASILESNSDKRPIVFITNISNGNALLKEFQKNALVMDVFYLINFGPTKRWLIKKVNALCKSKTEIILFGCNSKFFYETIPFLPKHIKAIDLIHAFVHEYEDGPEKWSLPVISNLSNRVVISQKTKIDFHDFYMNNHIPLEYLSRIIFIPNFVEEKINVKKDTENGLNILYVGRGGMEKRVHLISNAARLSAVKGLPISFHFVGDIADVIPSEDLMYCNLHGEITDIKLLDSLYAKSHILVLTSSREGFPMVIMEAMMHGVVPVVTNVGGISEHIIDKENGILINATDESEIINQLLKTFEYFNNNRSELRRISTNAFEYAKHNYNKQIFFRAYQNLLA